MSKNGDERGKKNLLIIFFFWGGGGGQDSLSLHYVTLTFEYLSVEKINIVITIKKDIV